MAWGGQFVFGDAFAAYFGPSDDNDLHEHAAYQIVLSAEADAIVIDETGDQHAGRGFLIRPMIPHAVQCDSDIALIYLDPQSGIALDLANRTISPHWILKICLFGCLRTQTTCLHSSMIYPSQLPAIWTRGLKQC